MRRAISRHVPVYSRNLDTTGDIERRLYLGGAENGPLRLYSGGVWDHPRSGKNQGKLRTNQRQLTPTQDCERKRKFREPRFVADNQAVMYNESWHTKFPFSYLAHVTLLTPAQARLSSCSGFAQASSPCLPFRLSYAVAY